MTTPQKRWGKTLAGLTTALLMAGGLAVQAVPAQADPDAVKAAEQKLQQLQEEHSKLDLRYAQLDAQLTAANAEVTTLTKDLASQESKVSSMKGVVARIALTRHQQGGGLNGAAQLLAAPDDTSFMRQLATLESVGTRTQALVQQYQTEQAKVASTKATLTSKRDEVAKAKQEQSQVLAQHEVKEAEAQKTLDRLTKEEQQRLARLQAERARAQAEAVAARERANSRSSTARTETPTASSPSASASRTTTPAPAKAKEPTVSVPASGRASVAVNAALSKRGYPYVFGATGPNAFDCSGLTGWAWRQAGVSLPRTSQGQYSAGVRVSASQLQPGDLVFYYSGISHVGMYIGNGMIVHAANPRSDVTVIGLYSMPFMGGRRVG